MTCAACGFDPDEWNDQDATRTLLHAGDLLAGWSEGASGQVADRLAARAAEIAAGLDDDRDLRVRVHQLWHGLVSLAEDRDREGDALATQRGEIVQLNASGGGVPKLPVDEVEVGRRGLRGDVQATRVHHGRPWQALCLWSADVIGALAADGHPIAAGSAGENVTVRGIDWSSLRAGAIVELGAPDRAARCRLSAPAAPCQKNARWFTDGDVGRIDHDHRPGWSRWYASVLEPGVLHTGDPVVVSPR